MISIKDIARQAGMSPATVSRVINGKSHVHPEKRDQILKIIEETGYVPNKAARSMVLQRSFTVGIVVNETFNMFQRQLFSFIERRLEFFGYHTIFFFVQCDGVSEEDCLARLKSEALDGIIMLHEMKDPQFYAYTMNMGIPLVASTFSIQGVLSIHVNEEQAAFDAVSHLIGLGHRKIGMLYSGGDSFGRQRAAGFYLAHEALGLSRNTHLVVQVPYYSIEFGVYGMREFLLQEQDFSALFAATDELAIGAMRVLRDEGLRVPEDISVIGFDDIEIADYFIPRLTTVRQPLDELGEQTALNLHKLISGSRRPGRDLILPHKLIIRESTARKIP
ncbi:MAG: LacI family transcriptional regulator [Spirochaetaceae bacterium]|jgi:LacI family transcriptional regulator|nr:LacI family transcriptional regulator [Spirochaetaceae bacterium]